MDPLRISLFGRLHLSYGGTPLTSCASAKARELLCYLLLFRDRPHPREVLASLLWGDHCTTSQSKTYLRKALWQLQTGLNACHGLEDALLIEADAEWIQLHSIEPLWLDVAVFEEAYAAVQDRPGRRLDAWDAHLLQRGIAVYEGDLLEGWYQDWCLCERERLQQLHLIMLDKLMEHCEQTGAYEAGLRYGETSLRCDRARERTYQQLMRLHVALRDRTGALRQYARCVAALREELDVAPSARTNALRDAIRRDDAALEPDASEPGSSEPGSSKPDASEDGDRPARPRARPDAPTVSDRLDHIITLQHRLARLHTQLQRELEAVEGALHRGTA